MRLDIFVLSGEIFEEAHKSIEDDSDGGGADFYQSSSSEYNDFVPSEVIGGRSCAMWKLYQSD